MTTSGEIIYQRRVRVLALAEELGNIAKACRLVGVSRTRFYEWKHLAESYGLEALCRRIGGVRNTRTRPRLMS